MNGQPDDPYLKPRKAMVRDQIAARGIKDKILLNVLRSVPRHRFVPSASLHEAYADHPLPIPGNQTISQPYMVAIMTEKLHLTGREKVLEIGTGSGYQTAVLARLAGHVHSIERVRSVHEYAARNLEGQPENDRITLHLGDGTRGLKGYAPYDRILVTAGAPVVPVPCLDQLADNGIMVIPVGDRYCQTLKIFTRSGEDIKEQDDLACVFVPLVGQYGWKEG